MDVLQTRNLNKLKNKTLHRQTAKLDRCVYIHKCLGHLILSIRDNPPTALECNENSYKTKF